jgi:hypothetical protein
VASEREVGVDSLLERPEPQLAESRPHRRRERLPVEIRERLVAPEPERLVQQRRPLTSVGRRTRPLPERREPVDVEPPVLHREDVARRAGGERGA